MSARGNVSRRAASLVPLAGALVAFALGAETGAGGRPPEGAPTGVQFRVSAMGGLGDPDFHGISAAVAYNAEDDEYLVVWSGDDDVGGLLDGEFEIFGQRLDASGAEIGADDFRISDMGGTGDPDFLGVDPAVVWNSRDNQYLVVWTGEDDVGGLVDGELEIFGQRLDAAGAEIGANDFRISDLGPDGSATYRASAPALAYDAVANAYLVVWHGDDDTGGLVDQELEIFGQRLDAAGAEIGANDFRISDMGGTGVTLFAGRNPAVVHAGSSGAYLVVWEGDDDAGGLVNDEFEIFGQRLDAASGAEIGANDFRISDLGGTGDPAFLAFRPAVAWNDADGEYLAVWHGDDDAGGLGNDEIEVFGQRLDAAGAEVGANDFRISATGPDGDLAYVAVVPAVAWDAADRTYLVVWHGDEAAGGLVDDEFEIFGQGLAASGAPVGIDDFRISVAGGTGAMEFLARNAALVHDGSRYLVAWEAEDDGGGLVDGEFEIFAEPVEIPLFADGFESGDTAAWSSATP